MAISMKINDKQQEIKFNYGLLFELNRRFEGVQGGNNGAGLIYSRMLSGDDSAIVDIIKTATKVDDETAAQAFGDYAESLNENALEGMNEAVQAFIDEVEYSGFFKREILKFTKQIEKALEKLAILKKNTKDETRKEELTAQIESMAEMLELLNSKN